MVDENSEVVNRDTRKVNKLDKKGGNQAIKHLDLGEFTSTEGFSLATQAKTKNIPHLAVLINPSEFHSRTKNIQ